MARIKGYENVLSPPLNLGDSFFHDALFKKAKKYRVLYGILTFMEVTTIGGCDIGNRKSQDGLPKAFYGRFNFG